MGRYRRLGGGGFGRGGGGGCTVSAGRGSVGEELLERRV